MKNNACVLVILLLLFLTGQAQGSQLQMVYREAGHWLHVRIENNGERHQQALDPDTSSPLGSVWKLFMYAYLVETNTAENPYQCQGREQEEVYCCEPGGHIDRDNALLRSCSLYFAPERWQVNKQQWDKLWGRDVWLIENAVPQANTRVKIGDLMLTLEHFPERARWQAQRVLMELPWREQYGKVLQELGTRLRVKTYSWKENDQRIGGFAGWLSDGQAIWAQAPGTSVSVMQQWSPFIAQNLPQHAMEDTTQSCVDVNMFTHYPIKSITALTPGLPLSSAPLRGRYRVDFESGTHVELQAHGEMTAHYSTENLKWTMQARLSVNEYVARVLEREAGTEPREAARALAVTARTYLFQNGEFDGQCWRIDDDTRHQRVAPEAAPNKARFIADFTDGMLVDYPHVQFHQDQSKDGQLSWKLATDKARDGWHYTDILRKAFSGAGIVAADRKQAECVQWEAGTDWLYQHQRRWQAKLMSEAGYAMPGKLEVCQLQQGNAHVDYAHNRLYVAFSHESQGLVALSHEYLHLAFYGHPHGQDERFIEALANELVNTP